jgi:hypothetical protein
MEKNGDNKIIIFKTADEKILVDVWFEDKTVWLSQDQMGSLFETMRKAGNPDFSIKPTNS